jgi:hypothetical protein
MYWTAMIQAAVVDNTTPCVYHNTLCILSVCGRQIDEHRNGVCGLFSGGDHVGLDHCDVSWSPVSEIAQLIGLSWIVLPSPSTDPDEDVPPVLWNGPFSTSPRDLWTVVVISFLYLGTDHPGVCAL